MGLVGGNVAHRQGRDLGNRHRLVSGKPSVLRRHLACPVHEAPRRIREDRSERLTNNSGPETGSGGSRHDCARAVSHDDKWRRRIEGTFGWSPSRGGGPACGLATFVWRQLVSPGAPAFESTAPPELHR
jgi:hypothetical protein